MTPEDAKHNLARRAAKLRKMKATPRPKPTPADRRSGRLMAILAHVMSTDEAKARSARLDNKVRAATGLEPLMVEAEPEVVERKKFGARPTIGETIGQREQRELIIEIEARNRERIATRPWARCDEDEIDD